MARDTHHIKSHHITTHHITSHHITTHHITSHHITSHHITSHHNRVAPNIYSLGYASVVTLGGWRIGGVSGIFNDRHFHMGAWLMTLSARG